MKFKISNMSSKVSAVVVSSLLSTQAFAQGSDIASVSTTISTNVFSLGTVMTNVAFISGGGLCCSAALMAKKSADDHGQTPMAKAGGRAFAGAALLAFPWIANNLMNSLGTGAANSGTGISDPSQNRFN